MQPEGWGGVVKTWLARRAEVARSAIDHRVRGIRVGLLWRSVVGWLGTVAAAGVFFMPGIGVGASAPTLAVASKPVPASTYVQAACAAVARANSQVAANRASLSQVAQAYQAQPSKASATRLKQALVSYLRSAVPVVNDLSARWKAAGVPDTKNGAAFAKALIASQQAGVAPFKLRIAQAQRIDLSSPTRFAAGVNALQAGLNADASKVSRLTLKDPAIKGAPPVLHPLVAFIMTGQTCA